MSDPREEPQNPYESWNPTHAVWDECADRWCAMLLRERERANEAARGWADAKREVDRERERAEAAEAELRRTEDFTVTGDELDLCLARAERAEAALAGLMGANPTIDLDAYVAAMQEGDAVLAARDQEGNKG